VNYIPHRLASVFGFAFCDGMLDNRGGGSADAEQSAWGPQSEKHISLGSNSDAISEIFPALFDGGF
jgi:hypothetical protein